MGGKEKFNRYIKVLRPLYIREKKSYENEDEVDTSKKKYKKYFKLINEPYYIKRKLPSEEADNKKEKSNFDDEDLHFTQVTSKVYYSNKINPNIYHKRNFEIVGLPLFRKIYGDDDGEFIRYILIQVPIYIKNISDDGYKIIKKRFYIRRDDIKGEFKSFGEDEEDIYFNEYNIENLYISDSDKDENISCYINEPFGDEDEGFRIIKIAIYIKKDDEESEKLFVADDAPKIIDTRNIKNKNMTYLKKPNVDQEDVKYLHSYLDRMRTGFSLKPLNIRRVVYKVIKENRKKKKK